MTESFHSTQDVYRLEREVATLRAEVKKMREERLEEEGAAPEGTATVPATGASDTHFAASDSTVFPTEPQVEQLGRAQGFAVGGVVPGPSSDAKPLVDPSCTYVIPKTRQDLISELRTAESDRDEAFRNALRWQEKAEEALEDVEGLRSDLVAVRAERDAAVGQRDRAVRAIAHRVKSDHVNVREGDFDHEDLDAIDEAAWEKYADGEVDPLVSSLQSDLAAVRTELAAAREEVELWKSRHVDAVKAKAAQQIRHDQHMGNRRLELDEARKEAGTYFQANETLIAELSALRTEADELFNTHQTLNMELCELLGLEWELTNWGDIQNAVRALRTELAEARDEVAHMTEEHLLLVAACKEWKDKACQYERDVHLAQTVIGEVRAELQTERSRAGSLPDDAHEQLTKLIEENFRIRGDRVADFVLDQVRSWLSPAVPAAEPIGAQLDHAVRVREATPGMPADGPYPASVGEVADEVVAWIEEMDRTHASGLIGQVFARLKSPVAVPVEPTTEETTMDFRDELQHLINRHSRENGSDTPDFILAFFLGEVLEAFDATLRRRDSWYGKVDTVVEPYETATLEEALPAAFGSSETTSGATPSEVQATPNLGDRVVYVGQDKQFPKGVGMVLDPDWSYQADNETRVGWGTLNGVFYVPTADLRPAPSGTTGEDE